MPGHQRPRLPGLLAGAVLSLLVTAPLQADSLDHMHALDMSRQGRILPAQQLLDRAFSHYPQSRLLEMKLKHKRQRYVYKLQLLTLDGEIRKLYFDAENGELLRDKDKN